MIATEPYGPLTTHRMTGAGGPFNRWDCMIRAALRRGDPALADRLRAARAHVNLSLGGERVWIPTPSQCAVLGLHDAAVRYGVAAMPS